jgi:hypothetical protein
MARASRPPANLFGFKMYHVNVNLGEIAAHQDKENRSLGISACEEQIWTE